MHAKSLQSCLTLCRPVYYSPPGSSVHGILQTRILESVAVPSSRGSSPPRDGTPSLMSPALAGTLFTTSATWASGKYSRVQKEEERILLLPARTGPVKSHWMIASQFHFPLCKIALLSFLCRDLPVVHHGCTLKCNSLLILNKFVSVGEISLYFFQVNLVLQVN